MRPLSYAFAAVVVVVAILAGGAVADDVDCVLSPPRVDGPCSKLCGGGVQMLLRDVVTAQEGDGKACPFPLAETVACNTQPCPEQQPELRASDGDFEIHLGSEHTLKVVTGDETVDILAKLEAAGDASANELRDLGLDLMAVSAEVGAVSSATSTRLDSLGDALNAAVDTIGNNYETLDGAITRLDTNKADRVDLDDKADKTAITGVTDLLNELNEDLRGSFDAQHNIHNASLKLLFDELDGLTSLTQQLDSDINSVDAAKDSLEKRVMSAEVSLAAALTARDSLESARNSLETRVSTTEQELSTIKELLLAGGESPFGTGADGDFTLASGQELELPNFALVSDADAGVDVIVLDACGDLKKDDELFLHQTQYKDGILAGRYAYVKIRAVTAQGSTCVVALTAPLNTPFRSGVYSMNDGPYAAQAALVPQWDNVNIAGTLLAPAWDGKKGGIIVFKATGLVTITGLVDASVRGFRGAPQRVSGSDYVCGFAGESEAAIFAPNGNSLDCRSFGSGGGPGNGQGGGYGGGHATVGNKPGCGGCDAGCGNGLNRPGITGLVPMAPDSIGDEDFVRILFGGSGAASGSHSHGNRNGAQGGGSGGIIIISGMNAITGSGTVRAQGGNGMNGYRADSQPMGGGGGGAGGAVWLRTTGVANVQNVQVNGGAGGGGASYSGCNPGTPGGNGGDGRVFREII